MLRRTPFPLWLPAAACLLALAFPVAGCGSEPAGTSSSGDEVGQEGDDQEGHDHSSGPHGGPVVVVGDEIGHVEIVHVDGDPEILCYVLDADMAPIEVSAPVLNLMLADGSTRVEGEKAPEMGWRFRHAAFTSHDHKGRMRVEIGGKTYNVDLAHQHEGHDHEGCEHGPHDGVMADFGAGVLELKLHDDKGDLELWLYADAEGSKPFDLPLDAAIVVSFPDRKEGEVPLRVRNAESNEDEDGEGNIRDGKTNYFIFPGDTGADASWLQGGDFEAEVVVAFRAGNAKHSTERFTLTPHTHHAGHGHDDHAEDHDEHDGHDDDHDDHAEDHDDHDEHDDDG